MLRLFYSLVSAGTIDKYSQKKSEMNRKREILENMKNWAKFVEINVLNLNKTEHG